MKTVLILFLISHGSSAKGISDTKTFDMPSGQHCIDVGNYLLESMSVDPAFVNVKTSFKCVETMK